MSAPTDPGALPGDPAGGATTVVVHPDAATLAEAAAARLVVALLDAQAARGEAALVLTGGSVAAHVYGALARHRARTAVDWSRVDLWWGDERFLPAGHPDRNETQARAALLDGLPLDPGRVHAMPASDGPDGEDPEAAAARYAAALAAAGGGRLPRFDVVLLGIGPDAHVASVFPDHPLDAGLTVSAVRDSPKPPPTRITLTLPTLNTADEVWLIVAGREKAGAVGLARSGASAAKAPAGAVHGRVRTRWLLDRDAAAELR
ncbi:6-phosphogluconolactonase [Pilimelia terevasa]|uniref:6-phosphogluconolactonase n=1 Tax=Pilimelia terevasa TaxID=53372 RepID=A0A8J3FI49_9ACTN|nr:6-phosphogluconolactonase [Pilimelia terevasa]GGK23895.1 6-phosphogluconolactonase [Pilimelia terevasa]